MKTHEHVPNGLRARDENGRMVCARCGQGYDDTPTAAKDRGSMSTSGEGR